MKEILFQFGLHKENVKIQHFGNGLINSTWLVETASGDGKYILQKINDRVFKNPEDIAFNTRLIDDYLGLNFSPYTFASPCKTIYDKVLVKTKVGYYRMFRFIENSHTVDVVEKPQQAYEAAKQFGQFTKLLSGFDASLLKITIADFHNVSLRLRQFDEALDAGNRERIAQAEDLITSIIQHKSIADEYENNRSALITRVTHHDTKISNVLFDNHDNGICVIDLDTVMPGYFISDVGDMMRTYLCPVSEEEKDFSKITIRSAFYDAIVNGYLSEMRAVLSEQELTYFHFAGKFMIYMQAIRFLTDHINDDIYYGAKYDGHNFVRAGNQLTLLQRLIEFNPG
ncbi:MAG: aminoglycoside phosphotransferase family protein [Chitinophagaceae bacterium]|nr:aminoglycoside phosphotransferase family protein [Chitinophagaceae bacterium]